MRQYQQQFLEVEISVSDDSRIALFIVLKIQFDHQTCQRLANGEAQAVTTNSRLLVYDERLFSGRRTAANEHQNATVIVIVVVVVDDDMTSRNKPRTRSYARRPTAAAAAAYELTSNRSPFDIAVNVFRSSS